MDDDPGFPPLVRKKDPAADDAFAANGGTQPAAVIEKAKVRRRRVMGRKTDVVPPGNAVLGEHDRSVVAEQRRQPRDQAAKGIGFQRADDNILPPEPRRVVRCVHFRQELVASNAQRQASRLRRLKVRPAHHAGHLMSGQPEPYRKMGADGACAEYAYPDGGGFLLVRWIAT